MMKVLLFTLLLATGVLAQEDTPDKRLQNARMAFQETMASPDKGIPRDLLEKARCAVIVPDLKKGAFVLGGKYGRGFASCRTAGGWSAPAAVRIEGGSFGLQLGASSTDVIMLVMNQRGMDRLLTDKFTIGGEAAAAAGPIGRETSANTDALLRAEILSWSRSRGLFAGLSLEGATLRPDGEENRKLYGREVTNREILEAAVTTPSGARSFVATLNRYTGAKVGEASRIAPEALEKKGGRLLLGEKKIHFASGRFSIPPEAEPALSDVAKTLRDNPNWNLRVDGYTDNIGSPSSNLRLSGQRATAVADWLASHGVDRHRLTAKGHGETQPIADNSTEDGRAQNRRVELVRE